MGCLLSAFTGGWLETKRFGGTAQAHKGPSRQLFAEIFPQFPPSRQLFPELFPQFSEILRNLKHTFPEVFLNSPPCVGNVGYCYCRLGSPLLRMTLIALVCATCFISRSVLLLASFATRFDVQAHVATSGRGFESRCRHFFFCVCCHMCVCCC